jgi:hypothetical protein
LTVPESFAITSKVIENDCVGRQAAGLVQKILDGKKLRQADMPATASSNVYIHDARADVSAEHAVDWGGGSVCHPVQDLGWDICPTGTVPNDTRRENDSIGGQTGEFPQHVIQWQST